MSSAASKPFRKEDIAGKAVIDSSGRNTGKVKDVTFTLEGMITLIVERNDGSEVSVQMSRVMGVSDNVVVRDESTPKMLVPSPGMTICRSCGHEAPIGTLWCPACGKSLA